MRAILSVPPEGPLVELPDLKLHLRVDDSGEDALIAAYELAATSHLDGCYGALGRCILPQTWLASFDAAGCYRLPVPDVSSVTASAGTATLSYDGLWPVVDVTEACIVTFIAGLPERDVEIARQIVRFMVAHWYANREAVLTGSISGELPMTADFLISHLRRGLL